MRQVSDQLGYQIRPDISRAGDPLEKRDRFWGVFDRDTWGRGLSPHQRIQLVMNGGSDARFQAARILHVQGNRQV
ncbi:MAG TPA: hypothetical protein VN973_14890 [Candidatus Dormibacteraeota bacterium]|nr:hypothetical protein [Candidatus Dormibacteraeota bacterium]